MSYLWKVQVNMSSKHIKTKNTIKDLEKADFLTLIDRLMLSETEEQMMKMIYMKRKTMNQIADELGYSEAGIIKAHQRIIKKISKIF